MNNISRRSMMRGTLSLAASLSFSGCLHGDRSRKNPPNLLYIFPDEWRQHALGFMKSDPVLTPNLDKFAAESVVFVNAVSNIPICSPHRAMLMTGQYPSTNGVYTNCNSGQPNIFLNPDTRTISNVLSDNGYDCGYIGKYHLDCPTEEDAKYGEGPRGKPGKRGGGGIVWDAYTPPGKRRHGFNFWHSYGCCDNHFNPHYWTGSKPVSQPTQVNRWSVWHETDVAEAFIRNADGKQRDPNKPFALFIAHNPPHMPFSQVPDEYKAIYADKTPSSLLVRKNLSTLDNGTRITNGSRAPQSVQDYFAMITGIDQQFAKLLKALKENSLEQNTIVIFSSDHGEMMGSHNLMGKGVFYDESFLIPFIMRYPDKLKPRIEKMHLNTPDIMPTLLGIMGLGDEIPESVEGTDFSRVVLTGKGARAQSSFYIGGLHNTSRSTRAVRTDRYTFVVQHGGKAGYFLYDRETDPYQMRSCAAEHPEICRELTDEMNRWLKKTNDPWTELPWPIVFKNVVAVRSNGLSFKIDLTPEFKPGMEMESIAPYSRIEPDAKGQQWLRSSSMNDQLRHHEYLRISDKLKPETEYKLCYTCKLNKTSAPGELYHLVRSPSSQHRALREYWQQKPGQEKTISVDFTTGQDRDYQLIFGLHYQADVSIRDISVREMRQKN
jgi:arylsulfatase A-like enzyme